MNIDLKDHLKATLDRLNPLEAARAFSNISAQLENVIRHTNEKVSRISANLIEDTQPTEIAGEPVTAERYQDILNRMLTGILSSSDYRGGLFCASTSPNWEHVQSAYILVMLHELQLPSGSWIVEDQVRSVEQIIVGLIGAQRANGSWGEDFYDTCLCLSALLLYKGSHGSLDGFARAISNGLRFVLDEIRSDFATQKLREWYGAGFYGVAMYLCGRHASDIPAYGVGIVDEKSVKTLIVELLAKAKTFLVEEHGKPTYFKSDDTSQPTTPNEWHTAEMLIGLSYAAQLLNAKDQIRELTTNCLRWLNDRRGSNRLWCHNMGSRLAFIITGRVLHALALTDDRAAGAAIARLRPVLLEHEVAGPRSTGLICDLPVTINLMLGISAKKSVRKRIDQNALQSVILAQFLHDAMEEAGRVKNEADRNALAQRKRVLWFTILIVVAFMILTLPTLLPLLRSLGSGYLESIE